MVELTIDPEVKAKFDQAARSEENVQVQVCDFDERV